MTNLFGKNLLCTVSPNLYFYFKLAFKHCFNLNTPGHIRYLTMTESKLIWMPDTFFRNEKIGKVRYGGRVGGAIWCQGRWCASSTEQQ